MNPKRSKLWLSLPICCQQMLDFANRTNAHQFCSGAGYGYHKEERRFEPETPEPYEGNPTMNPNSVNCTLKRDCKSPVHSVACPCHPQNQLPDAAEEFVYYRNRLIGWLCDRGCRCVPESIAEHGHSDGCPMLKNEAVAPVRPETLEQFPLAPELSSPSEPKDYTVPVCPVLWRVTISDEPRTIGTYVLARSAAMALAAVGRFYDWPRLSFVTEEKATCDQDAYAVLSAEISVQCHPQKMLIIIKVYPVRALDEYASHMTSADWERRAHNPNA
jgi:hypothetical protein